MREWAVPPGQEALLKSMLLDAGSCTLTNAEVRQTDIAATYRCGEQTEVAILRHASQGNGTKTAQFDISAGEPSAGPELLAALSVNVRANESGWKWVEVEANGKGHDASEISFAQNPALWGVAALIIGLSIFLFTRRRD